MSLRAIALAALALAACTRPDEELDEFPGPPTFDSIAIARADQSRIAGDSTAPVWIVIVSDFQCPYCKIWHDSVYPALRKELVDRGGVRLAYLHMPLSQHQHAEVTAELAMCAGEQGQFWEMHDVLFETQSEWSSLPRGTEYFRALASRVPVDTARIGACLDAGTMRPIVAADYDRALRAQARSTPSFFIGDSLLVGVLPIERFRSTVANEMRRRAAAGGKGGS